MRVRRLMVALKTAYLAPFDKPARGKTTVRAPHRSGRFFEQANRDL